MRPLLSTRLSRAVVTLGWLAGCGGGGDDPGGSGRRIETRVSSNAVVAGAAVEVRCVVEGAGGGGEQVALDVIPTPQSASQAGDTFTVSFTARGTYALRCRTADGALRDETGAQVEVAPGPPSSSETAVSATSVGPTEPVEVTCELVDAFGNVSDVEPEFEVRAEDGPLHAGHFLERTGGAFSLTRAGTYHVACAAPGPSAIDDSPAVVAVHPGLPASLTVELAPQACYRKELGLPLDVEVLDHWENPLGDDAVEVRAAGVALPRIADGLYALPGDGDFTVEVAPLGPTHGGVAIPSEQLAVRVDSTPPVIEIASPARAGRVNQGGVGPSAVAVAGSVADAVSSLASVVVNGAPQPIPEASSSATIGVEQVARWGMNVVTATAEDACGNRAAVAQSYLRGGAWYPDATSATATARTSGGFVSHLNQPIIDDFNRADPDDLATLAQALLRSEDFNALVPAGQDLATDALRSTSDCSFCQFWADTGYLVERDPLTSRRIQWTGPDVVRLEVIDGGLWAWARLTNFDFPLRVWAATRECACGIDATQTMDVRGWAGAGTVEASGPVAISLSAGAPRVTLGTLATSSTGLYLDVDCAPWADWLCDFTTDTVVPLIAGLVEDALAGAVAAELEPLLEEFLASHRLEPTFSLPPPLARTDGSPDLHADAVLDRILFCGPTGALPRPAGCPSTSPNPGYARIGHAVQVYPPERGGSVPAGGGAIRKDPTCTSSSGGHCFSSSPYAFGLGVSDELVNQLLWASWYGGALELDEGDVAVLAAGGVDLGGLSVRRVTPLAPPVVMPDYGDREIAVGWGDLRVEATVDLGAAPGGEPQGLVDVTLYVSAVLSGSLALDPAANRLAADVAADPQLWVQIVEIEDPAHHDAARDLLAQHLPPLLARLLDDALGALPLPRFDLSAAAGLPAGTVWELADGVLEREAPGPNVDLEDYYRLTGGLR